MRVSELRGALEDALGPTYRVEREVRPVGECRLFVAVGPPTDPELLVKVLPAELSLAVDAAVFERGALLVGDRLSGARAAQERRGRRAARRHVRRRGAAARNADRRASRRGRGVPRGGALAAAVAGRAGAPLSHPRAHRPVARRRRGAGRGRPLGRGAHVSSRPVLCYHRVGGPLELGVTRVARSVVARQMTALAQAGWQTLTLD